MLPSLAIIFFVSRIPDISWRPEPGASYIRNAMGMQGREETTAGTGIVKADRDRDRDRGRESGKG
jgi:hypothetical protein